jgi:hypothetical protein
MKRATSDLQREYERIHRRASEDPGTAGDEGEENWARLLRIWLPPAYPIVTKGRILGQNGSASPQVDVLVLNPNYPTALRDTKVYLAGGVLAAFECKLSLEVRHIRKAMQTSAAIRRLLPVRTGTPFRELHSPLVYGLLAHRHTLKAGGIRAGRLLNTAIVHADVKHVLHPREMLDLVCVSNTGTWVSHRITWCGPHLVPWSDELTALYGPEGAAAMAYVGGTVDGDPSLPDRAQSPAFTPVGRALCHLLGRLAWRELGLRDLAAYFASVERGTAAGGQQRHWPADIYSPAVRAMVMAGRAPGDASGPWNEWQVSI